MVFINSVTCLTTFDHLSLHIAGRKSPLLVSSWFLCPFCLISPLSPWSLYSRPPGFALGLRRHWASSLPKALLYPKSLSSGLLHSSRPLARLQKWLLSRQAFSKQKSLPLLSSTPTSGIFPLPHHLTICLISLLGDCLICPVQWKLPVTRALAIPLLPASKAGSSAFITSVDLKTHFSSEWSSVASN